MTTNYAFSDDTQEGILLPQRIRKSDLAFFYGRTPDTFRKEIDFFMEINRKRYYEKWEVVLIFKEFGSHTPDIWCLLSDHYTDFRMNIKGPLFRAFHF